MIFWMFKCSGLTFVKTINCTYCSSWDFLRSIVTFQNPTVFVKFATKEKYMNEMTNLRVFQISQDNKYATRVEATKAESVTPG